LTVLNLLIPQPSDLRLNPTESCDKFQNQTFKDQCPSVFPGDKKLNLGADFKVRVSRRSFHCRDKIEFNLKSQKLEELCRFGQTRLSCGTSTLGGRFCWSTEILNFLRCLHRTFPLILQSCRVAGRGN
jgi:hypothetical protein